MKVLRQLETHLRLLLVAEIGQFQHLLVQADGAVVFAAAAVQLAQAQLHFQCLRMGARHFRQRAGGDIGLVIDQRIQPLVKTGRHFACLFQYGAHVDARGQPAQTEKCREQQQPPQINIQNPTSVRECRQTAEANQSASASLGSLVTRLLACLERNSFLSCDSSRRTRRE
ncbi:hypothetical protein D3C72_1403730 [compost metagenome]